MSIILQKLDFNKKTTFNCYNSKLVKVPSQVTLGVSIS